MWQTFLKKYASSKASSRGFNLSELAIVIAILGILSAAAFGNWSMTSEVRDATAVQSAQAVLQQVITQGSTRMDVSPATLLQSSRQNIVNAANLLMQNRNDIRFSDTGSQFRVTITSSGRNADFAADATNGNVTLARLGAGSGGSAWTSYEPRNGIIVKR